MKYTRWTTKFTEPDADTVVEVDALDCSWRLPWKTVREDAINGLAAVYLTEEQFEKLKEISNANP